MSPVPLLQGKGLIKGKDIPYASPQGFSAPAENSTRRKNLRCLSFNHAIPSLPVVETPRTACPANGAAFSYNPLHLPAWYMAEDLWTRLPTRLTTSVTAVQHAGAAVFTGFERLDKLSTSLPEGTAAIDISISSHGLGDRTVSSGSSETSSIVSTPLSALTPTPFLDEPISPFSLSPLPLPALTLDDPIAISKRHSRRPGGQLKRSYTMPPMDPHTAYYARELSHLRTEALPVLRHAIRVVEREFGESKRLGEIRGSAVGELEHWLRGRKAVVCGLDQKGRIESGRWGVPDNGLGWSA